MKLAYINTEFVPNKDFRFRKGEKERIINRKALTRFFNI